MSAKKERPEPPAKPEPKPVSKATAEGVRRQRQHIKELDGADPLRAGIAD